MDFKLNVKRIVTMAFFWVAMANSFFLLGQCPQENLKVESIELRDIEGKLFDVNDNYAIGETVTGQVWVTISGNSTNAYTLYLTYDVFVNGALNLENIESCLFEAQKVQLLTPKFATILTWRWGDLIELKDIFMYWQTGNSIPNDSKCAPPAKNVNAQCYYNEPGIVAVLPLVPNFIYQSGQCNTTVQFTNETIGGTPPFNYTYIWDFDGLGTATGSNPVFNFPSSGTYTIGLTANDGTSITTIFKDIFIDPNFGIQVDIFPTKINDESGIIYVQSVTGGTPPYTYLWSGPDGFTSTNKDIFNLADGLYQLTVTDSNGCQQTEQYILDIASVLGFSWKAMEIIGDNSKVEICWEVTFQEEDCTFEIERSNGDISNFISVGTIPGVKPGGDNTQEYSFTDNSHSAFEKTFYYRIIRKSDEKLDYSPVKMFKKEGVYSNEKQWVVYPNPSLGKQIFLKYLGKTDFNQKKITIDIINSGMNQQSISLHTQLLEPINIKDLFSNLPKGHLILRVQVDKDLEVIQLIN